MKKKDSKEWPEIVISEGDRAYTQSIRRAVEKGI
jgi:hypothetical protein